MDTNDRKKYTCRAKGIGVSRMGEKLMKKEDCGGKWAKAHQRNWEGINGSGQAGSKKKRTGWKD